MQGFAFKTLMISILFCTLSPAFSLANYHHAKSVYTSAGCMGCHQGAAIDATDEIKNTNNRKKNHPHKK
jgi:hypothetical protein